MPAKIRLSRHGRKGHAFYHIVVADSRAPRDGRFIEKLGIYNPNTNPATIELNIDSALSWLQKGAQPTDTANRILSYKGVLLKKHLLGGVTKGALTAEQAEEKFQKWVTEKEAKVQAKREQIAQQKKTAKTKQLAAETKVNEARKQAIAKKRIVETTEAPAETTE